MLEFLLKYSPVIFSEGDISFRYVPSVILVVMAIIGLLLVLWFVYRRTTLELKRILKSTLIGLKFGAITLLLFALLEPVVNVSTIVPQKSSLLLLVDDSRSMSIGDMPGRHSRSQFVKGLLGDERDDSFLKKLGKNFKIQTFRFSSEVDPLTEINELSAGGANTHLAGTLKFASEMTRNGDVAAVVLLTDGVDNGNADPLETAALLQSKKVPIYAIGVGSAIDRDIELSKVAANHSVIENAVVEVSALLKSKNFDGKTVDLQLMEGNKIVKRESVQLTGAATRASIKFSPQKKGMNRYTLSVVGEPSEIIKENNSQSFLIDNRSRRAKVLYIEGYPRPEFKFIRRALDGDANIELISLLRTGADKFYRQGVKDKSVLMSGYPKLKKDLFKYDAIIFGSIEASFFSGTELENTLDFVSERGGGYLMLGGALSFAQGGYQGTPIEKMLPVELPLQNNHNDQAYSSFSDRFKIVLTPEGLNHPMLQLTSDESENATKWDDLPELEGYNPVGRAKPGATVLATHPLSDNNDPKIILATERFGRGRSMAFATSSSWLWQMHMDHTDMSHERFWRQVLRWLALSSPEPIGITLNKEIFVPNEQVTLHADVRDSTYAPIDGATIKARITTPDGKIDEVSFHWSSNGKVEYVAAYHPAEEGFYAIELTAYSMNGKFLGRAETAFFVEQSREEFTNAQLQEPLLKRIAEISGGKYYREKEAARLPDEITTMESSYSKMVEYDLWDVPLLFLLVILILSVEWYLRRNKGLS